MYKKTDYRLPKINWIIHIFQTHNSSQHKNRNPATTLVGRTRHSGSMTRFTRIHAQLPDLPEFQLNYPIHPSLNSCSSLMYRSPNLTVRFACFWKIGVKSRVGAPQKMEDSRGEILISLTLVFWSTERPKAKWGFFRQITTFIKVCVAYVIGFQSL